MCAGRHVAVRLFWGLWLWGLVGCATPAAHVAWPPPPAVERVRLVGTLKGPADLDGRLARLWRRISGAQAPGQLYHPVGVAVTPGGEVLAVTDQALAEVFVFDLERDRVAVVEKDALGGPPVGVAMEGDHPFVIVPATRMLLGFRRDGSPYRSLSFEDCERPTGVAIDAANNRVFVADTAGTGPTGHAIHVHAFDTNAHLATLGRKGEGPGELFFPTFVSLSPRGVYVADTMNARVQELGVDGTFLRQIGERGDQFGQFDKPKGIATDAFGNVYVVDSFFSVVQIFNREGRLLLFFGGRGDSLGFLSNPAGIAIDAKNRIYVANGLNFRVEVYQLVNTSADDSHLAVPTVPAD